MKLFVVFIVSAILFVGLSYAGKAVFGMDDGMRMGSIECVNHCIDQAVIPSSVPPAIFAWFLVIVVFAQGIFQIDRVNTSIQVVMARSRRRSEPIRLFLLSQKLSPVIIRD